MSQPFPFPEQLQHPPTCIFSRDGISVKHSGICGDFCNLPPNNDTGDVQIRMDSGRGVGFNIREHPHLDHGYTVTSHSSQGQTAERVLIHVDTDKSELLINNRFAYVSVSRAQYDAEIYTNDKSELGRDLNRDVTQHTAIPSHGQEPTEIGT